MKNTKELENFENLTKDPSEYNAKIKVVFLNKQLLDMADEYKESAKNKQKHSNKDTEKPRNSLFKPT